MFVRFCATGLQSGLGETGNVGLRILNMAVHWRLTSGFPVTLHRKRVGLASQGRSLEGKEKFIVANAERSSILSSIGIFVTIVRLTDTQTYFTPAELIDFSLLEQTTEHLDRKFCGFFFSRD